MLTIERGFILLVMPTVKYICPNPPLPSTSLQIKPNGPHDMDPCLWDLTGRSVTCSACPGHRAFSLSGLFPCCLLPSTPVQALPFST